MSQIDIKVEEYKSLRSGIDMHLKHIPEILAFMVAATSALLGYGFSLGVPFVFLTPLRLSNNYPARDNNPRAHIKTNSSSQHISTL